MSICFDDNSLIINSDISSCCTFINSSSNTYINISNCQLGYNNSIYISNKLVMNDYSNFHNSNIITSNLSSLYGWSNIYTSNINTNNISIDPFCIELYLNDSIPSNLIKVPFNSSSIYWNNNSFTTPKKGLYSINFSWCSQNIQSPSSVYIKKNSEKIILSDTPNGSKELIIKLNVNDIIEFYNDYGIIQKNNNSITRAIITLIVTLIN